MSRAAGSLFLIQMEKGAAVMTKYITVVPHFHWDREWYFTAEESQILLVNDMEEILSRLENDPAYPYFVLDGQTVVLEDYFAVMPEARERVRKLVEAGRLIIGPWYTQTDEMVVGGESIVRNLLYGKLDCDAFGKRMMIGYLPDSFGQSAQMPQILNGFGIRRSIFWRGTSERMGTAHTEFLWRDGNGSEVTVQLMPLGYAIGKYLPTDRTALKKRLDKYWPVLDKGATTQHLLLPNGHDQMPIQKNITEVMQKIEEIYPDRRCALGRYEDLFDEIEKNHDSMAVLSGEFLDGRYMRVHRSIFSTRADLKADNTRVENKLTNLLEPLAAVAYALGFAYPHGLIEKIWKELMKNHAHDSMGCCCSDIVHEDIRERYRDAEIRTDQLIRFYMRKLTDTQSCAFTLDKLTAFNLLPYQRKTAVQAEIVTKMKSFTLTDETGREIPFHVLGTEIVDAGLIDRQIVHYGNYDPFLKYTVALEADLPAMGYRTYFIKDNKAADTKEAGRTAEAADAAKTAEIPAVPALEPEAGKAADCLDNAYYHVTVNPDGTLTLLDKTAGKTYRDLLLLEDGSDDGDEYDYSPLQDDFVVDSRNTAAEISIRRSALWDEAVIRVPLSVPSDLAARKERKLDSSVTVVFRVRLRKDSRFLEICAEADNAARDHRLRVLFPGNTANAFSVSDNQFGAIRRPVRDSAMDVWEKEKWTERPDSIYPFLSFVHGDSAEAVAVITGSVREYELIGEDYRTLAVTLFRSVGVLGKEELYRRPGRPSGIRMETPDSQMIGKHSYCFALTTALQDTPRLAKEYLTPVITYNKMPYNAMKLNVPTEDTPHSFRLLSVDAPEVTLSVLKKAERKDELVLRLYNASAAVDMSAAGKVQDAETEPVKPAAAQSGTASVCITAPGMRQELLRLDETAAGDAACTEDSGAPAQAEGKLCGGDVRSAGNVFRIRPAQVLTIGLIREK